MAEGSHASIASNGSSMIPVSKELTTAWASKKEGTKKKKEKGNPTSAGWNTEILLELLALSANYDKKLLKMYPAWTEDGYQRLVNSELKPS